MVKTFCDRCGKETTGEKHGAIHGIGDADDNGGGSSQAPDCFDIVCDACFDAWRTWMGRPIERKDLEQPAAPIAPYPEVPRDLFDGAPPSTWDAISRAYFRGMVAGEHLTQPEPEPR